MSKARSQKKGSQKLKKQVDTTPTDKVNLEPYHNQQLSKNLEPNVSEDIHKNIHLPIQTSNNGFENLNQLSDSFNNEEVLEVSITQHVEVQSETELGVFPTTVNYPTGTEGVENIFYPQQPLILEKICSQLVILQDGIKNIQASIESLREEVNDLKSQKISENLDVRIIPAPLNISHQQKLGSKQSRVRKVDFNAVIYLQEHGEDKLREELADKDNTELGKIIRSEGIKTAKDLKIHEREDIIREIILNAKRRLKQGSVFLKD